MGGRKFGLGIRRKNAERKGAARRRTTMILSTPPELLKVSKLIVSLPLAVYLNSEVQSLEALVKRLPSCPSQFKIVSQSPLTLCRIRTVTQGSNIRADILFTVNVREDFSWTVSVVDSQVEPSKCPMLRDIPPKLSNVSVVQTLLETLHSLKICVGNPDEKLIEVVHHRAQTLHGGCSNSSSSYIDKVIFPSAPSVRHTDCQLLLPQGFAGNRCSACVSLRTALKAQSQRLENKTVSTTHVSKVNYRYQPIPELVNRLTIVHQQLQIAKKQCDRMKQKIANVAEVEGVTLDDEVHQDLLHAASKGTTFLEGLSPNSFAKIFWDQQIEAATKKNARSMRWHPLMIRWCLYLIHRSSGAYEALRCSGCVRLPSQRTLRDYSHYIPANTGFSTEVDKMLMETAKVTSCPERNTYTLLLLDEMHIREDLVFDKHTGAMIGFTDLGDINNHLVQLEKSLEDDKLVKPKLAKTMMVFMVRGLFSSLQFPYAQFPCVDLSGDLLYDPFWEAVRRIENCGLKVLGATLDGNSVNRRLVKLHQSLSSTNLVYKVKNPHAPEGCRDFFFISDPPHLVKTVRNCWQSKHRLLWCKGKHISWSHLTSLYNRDTNPHQGIRMVPKLKFEHIHLTSFSKMRVDLAAQVLSGSVSKALKLTGGEEVSETVKFTEMMDKFFDALNVHNYTHGVYSRKIFQMPYVNKEDFRLKWLENDFFSYLSDWEKSVNERSGFTKTAMNSMLLSRETILGLKMTTKSFVELVRYLFEVPGVESFLSQRICQDPLERFFGTQRQRGGVHDNPNVLEFMKNTQALRVIQNTPAVLKGNCRGGKQDVCDEKLSTPLPKRQRRTKSKHLGLY